MPASPQRGRCSPPNTPIDARITANKTQNGRFRLAEPHHASLIEVPISRRKFVALRPSIGSMTISPASGFNQTPDAACPAQPYPFRQPVTAMGPGRRFPSSIPDSPDPNSVIGPASLSPSTPIPRNVSNATDAAGQSQTNRDAPFTTYGTPTLRGRCHSARASA